MKYICIILTAIFFISCQEKNSTDKIDIFSVPEKKIVQKEEIKLDSIIFPTEIYPFGEWIIGINLPNYSPNVFDFINKNTLQKEFSCIKYGNGANELKDCNPYFFQRIGDTIRINANMFMLNTLVFENKNLSLVATENIKANPLNNFIELNPKKFAFKSSLESPIYDIYDVKKEQNIASFGSYPDVKLSNVQEEADYANFFTEKTIFDTQSNQFFTFYTNIPLIRIYKDFKLVKEIWTMDSFDTDINNFYDEKSKIFYVKPHIRNGKIYVVYINKNLDDFSKDPSKNLLVFDTQGALIKRYKINKDFQSYTISEDETEFYGIDNSDPNHTVIFKGKL